MTHMQTTHVELELPYQCTICKFRASEHTKLVDHFYEVRKKRWFWKFIDFVKSFL